jgi:parallel beta-helix repeat protein
MNKLIFALFLIAITFSLALVGNLQVGCVEAYSEIGGIISSDVTWSNANGPYNLTGNVLIETGVTVTIQADTTLNFNGYYIRVNGTLILQPGVTVNFGSGGGAIQVNGLLTARGTSANPIHFNGAIGYWSWVAPPYYSAITFSKSSTSWNEQTGSGSIIEHAVLTTTTIETSSSIKISNNILRSGEIDVLAGSAVISGNSISSFIYIKGGTTMISNNQITNGYILFSGEHGGENATITNNVISDAQTISGIHAGIWFSGSEGGGGQVLVERNTFSNDGTGIYVFSPNVDTITTTLTIKDNTITGNDVGVIVSNSYVPTLTGNNLQNNTLNVKLLTDYSGKSKDFGASNNWWGTTDTSAIAKLIYDYTDDFNLGKVTYTPFLTSPNPNAQPDPDQTIPTLPTSTPINSPTGTPTAIPLTSTPTLNPSTFQTQNPTENPTATSSDQSGTQKLSPLSIGWDEIAIIALLIVVAALLVINILFKRRKT